MKNDVRDTILYTFEELLDAQLRAVRRLRKGEPEHEKRPAKKRLSQVDMAYDILRQAGTPLHIRELIAHIDRTFGVRPDRESLVSSLSKKIARGDRFLRTGPNTFGLREQAR